MIWNQWYAILESNELKKKGVPLGVKRLNENLVLWRTKSNEIICLFDKCAHRGAALSCGKIIDEEIQCPFHGLQFNSEGKCTYLPSRGRNAEIPSNFKVNSFPTKEEHGFIWIWYGDKQINYPELKWFDDLGDDFLYSTNKDPWKTHYSRAIENQLDVAHLWIVHHNTIGRGNQRVCDGPITRFENGYEQAWVANKREDGTISILPKDMGEPRGQSMINFIFPNIWMLYLGEKVRVFVAFVPIDDENTILYQRFYQKFMKIPILGRFMTWFSNKFNIVVLHQDRRVVQTQVPKITGLKIGENLFPADEPIIMYRKIRDKLQNENNGKQNK